MMIACHAIRLLLCLLLPQEGLPASQSAGGGAAIVGIVVDSRTGKGIRKASVVAHHSKGWVHVAVTDTGGRFALTDLQPGEYTLFAYRVDYTRAPYQKAGEASVSPALPVAPVAPFEEGRRGFPQQQPPGATTGVTILSVAPKQTLKGVEIRLTPTAAVSGRVLDKDGDALPGVGVMVFQVSWQLGKYAGLSIHGQATTDDLGEYRIYGVPSGKYLVAVTFPDFWRGMPSNTPAPVPTGWAYIPTYYPGTTDLKKAGLVTLDPGDDLHSMNVTAVPVRTVQVRGRVYDALTGRPFQNAGVNLQPPRGTVEPRTFAGSGGADEKTGEFVLLGVIPGSYTLTGRFQMRGRVIEHRMDVVVGDRGLDGVEFAVPPDVEITGHFAVVGSALKPDQVRLNLVLADEPNRFAASAQPGADGTFKFLNTEQGVYRLQVAGAWYDYYVKSLKVGGREAPKGLLTVDADTAGKPLEVVLSARGGHIDGIAEDETKPVGRAFLVLIPDRSRRDREDLYQEVWTGPDGHFVFAGIAPGEYTVFCWATSLGVPYRDPDWLAQYEARGTTVRVAEGARLELEVHAVRLDGSPQETESTLPIHKNGK